jgi:hypothetical protein
MKTAIHFCSCLTHFFREREMFQTKVVEKIKTHISCSVFFFFEKCAVYEILWKNVVERGRPQMTIWRMCNALWIPKATNTHNIEYILLFHCSSGCKNAPNCYVICTLPVFFFLLC